MTYSAIADVSTVLLELLKTNVGERSPIDPDDVAVASPAELDALASADLALFPYRIATDGARGSVNPTPKSGTSRRDPPVSLTVRYLVTPYGVDGDDETDDDRADPFERQRRLGTAIQIFNDNRRIEPADAPAPLYQDEPLTISIVDEPLEDLLSLWSQYPDAVYQPSATVEVSPVLVQSLNQEEFTRVEERETRLGRRSDEPSQAE